MPDAKVDLRVQKTEHALTEAMMRLLKEKPYDDITVSDLCDAAMVRRATFYKHFKDKDDFLDFCIERRLHPLEMDKALACGPAFEDMALEVARGILRFFRENSGLIERTGKRSEQAGIADILARKLARAMRETATEGDPPPEMLAAFFAGALLGVARWWHTDCPDMPEEALLGHMKTVLAACRLPKANETEEGNHER